MHGTCNTAGCLRPPHVLVILVYMQDRCVLHDTATKFRARRHSAILVVRRYSLHCTNATQGLDGGSNGQLQQQHSETNNRTQFAYVHCDCSCTKSRQIPILHHLTRSASLHLSKVSIRLLRGFEHEVRTKLTHATNPVPESMTDKNVQQVRRTCAVRVHTTTPVRQILWSKHDYCVLQETC